MAPIHRARNRLFWKTGLLYLLMLLVVLVALDTYVVRALKREYLEAAFSQLESLENFALTKPPQPSGIVEWSGWLAQSGVRVTLVASDGTVLADSNENPAKMENHGGRPEIRDAFAKGTGRAVRYSATLKHELVYCARSFGPGSSRLVLRLSVPVYRLNEGVARFRK